MGYLSEEQIAEIAEHVELKSSDQIEEPEKLAFECDIEEYNEFLSLANAYSSLNISKTHLLFDKDNEELIGYMALCNDTIRLSSGEKKKHGLKTVPFASIPALKIGKLAVSKCITRKSKGYGSFLIEMAKAFAYSLNESGIACRFLTVDADIEYDDKTVDFYIKNGFKVNKSKEYKEQKEKRLTVSMRMDIFNDIPKENSIDSNQAV